MRKRTVCLVLLLSCLLAGCSSTPVATTPEQARETSADYSSPEPTPLAPLDEIAPADYEDRLNISWVDTPDSSAFSSIGYCSDYSLLFLVFRTTGMYVYYDVPIGVWEQMQEAESKGRFFHAEIKEKYKYERIDKREDDFISDLYATWEERQIEEGKDIDEGLFWDYLAEQAEENERMYREQEEYWRQYG